MSRRPSRKSVDRRAAPTRIGDLVQKTAPGKAASQIIVSRSVWQEVAGVGFARRTHPTRFDRGTLWVEVASAGWAQELALVEKTILERLRARGVVVERLRYNVTDVARPERGGIFAPAKKIVQAAREMELPEETARAVAKVRDPDLRDVIAKTARAAARRKAEVDVRDAANTDRAVPRLPGNKR
jgi:hypothetical protein